MNRTERLLNLLQILRSYRYPVRGQHLADRLGVSIRTLYRDITTLQAQGAEIEGEVGIGYVLKPTFFLPPLMFTSNEIQALLLGTQWVKQFGDLPLSQAATDALNKILAVMPASIKKSLHTFTLRVGPPAPDDLVKEDLSLFREAIAHQKKISIVYQSEKDKKSSRTIWPLTIGYFTNERILVAWCEKKKDFRHFKTSCIVSVDILNECYSSSPEKLFQQWQAIQLQKHFTQQR